MAIENSCNEDSCLRLDGQEKLLVLQKEILEAVALSNEHHEQLNQLCIAAEAMLPEAVASVMLYEQSGKALYVRAAPNIPEIAIQRLNGLEPGPQSGSCGTAVFCEQAVYVENTATDHRWSPEVMQQFAIDFNIHACWSNPIQNSHGDIIGSFALSSFITRSPTKFEINLLSICANLASVILQRETSEKDLQRLAYYDPLTELPNRELLSRHLDHAVEQAHRHHTKLALLDIDIDNFKLINDSFGHEVGDQALKQLTTIMLQCIGEGDTLARTGGDEFLLLLENVSDALQVSVTAQNILQRLQNARHIDGMNITASIGISLYPEDATSPQELLRNADTAMYAAKAAGKNNAFFYRPELTQAIQSQISLTNELKQAVQNDEFELYFQPLFSAKNRAIVGAETLIRWQHPEKGLLTPISFIPIAEQNGLIHQITDWVIKRTCQKVSQWISENIPFKKISINLSADDVKAGFCQKIEDILYSTHCPAQFLEFEITESLLMEQGQSAIDELEKVRKLGISIALDDFGTGYSSLNQLRRLPVDRLKIDRSFIKDIPFQRDDITLVKMIISMGKNLSMEIVAEGIENEDQANLLNHEGCDYLQGFMLAKPMPEDSFIALLKPKLA